VWGPVSDRFQIRRTLIIWGEFLAAMGTALVWYAHRFPESPRGAGYAVIFGLTLVEIFWSMSNVGWSALISDIYPQKERIAVQGRLASLGGLGRMAGIGIGGLLYDGLGLRYNGWGFHEGSLFFIASAVMLLSILPLRWVPEGGIGRESFNTTRAEAEFGHSDTFAFFIFIVAMACINFGRNSVMVIQTQYLVMDSTFGVSSRELSNIVNTQSAAIILTGFSIGWIGRRIRDRTALILGTILAIASLVLLSATLNLTLIYLSNFLKGVSDVIILSSSYALAAALISPKTRARFFSVFNATFFLSWGLAGTLIVGPAADLLMTRGIPEALSYRISFALAAGITGIGLIIVAAFIRQKKRPAK